ncbi:hypothetical protein BTA51_04360 [Hahella sp. CCB-MM4]|uniref:DUF2782 domain-containing protein n=1 Tax=Hahella sp. (strain CCB-MM4) TaxID=1926491 RepID=UPI000B9AE0F1|nr:DUF2782 domain-containing protein [Hahella sp. CCB-MM4]OZG74255.1 hypothetical protein BTA51_04360 [Hahella sp. CCB-MM4]
MSFVIRKVCIVLILALLGTGVSWAEEEADIKIRYGEDKTVYEYRVNGQLVEIKVVPKIGPAYYLVPADGGEFERSDTSSVVVPSWKILEW